MFEKEEIERDQNIEKTKMDVNQNKVCIILISLNFTICKELLYSSTQPEY